MKNLRKPLLLTLTAVALVGLAACNGGGETSKTSRSRASRGESSKVEAKEFDVTYDLNYEGAAAAETVKVSEEDYIADKNVTRDGYEFMGWATTADGATFYNFNDKPTAATTLYAKWAPQGYKKFVFEAEYCPCLLNNPETGKPMQGSTYSGGTNGKGLIQEDYKAAANASNGFYVHFLYQQGSYILWEIESDVAVDDAMIYMRLSGEYQTPSFSISKDMYPIFVNDTSIDYGTITFENVPAQGQAAMKFYDYALSTKISLKQGKNTIKMVTDNLIKHLGTALSTAPQQDCIKIYSKSNLTWPTADPTQIESDDE